MITTKQIITGPFWAIRKDLLKTLGVYESLLLAEIVYRCGREETKCIEFTDNDIAALMDITPYKLRNALAKLEEIKAIGIEYAGIPKKRMVVLLEDNVRELYGVNLMAVNEDWWPPEGAQKIDEPIEQQIEIDEIGLNIVDLYQKSKDHGNATTQVFEWLANTNPNYCWTANDGKSLNRVKHKVREDIRRAKILQGDVRPHASDKEIISVICGILDYLPEFYRDKLPFDFQMLERKYNALSEHYRDMRRS